jgi:hypothetical protein
MTDEAGCAAQDFPVVGFIPTRDNLSQAERIGRRFLLPCEERAIESVATT